MELRKDYILDRWVIIASNRAKRPDQFEKPKTDSKEKTDFFAPGNEKLTPPEIYRVSKGKGWKIRVIPNKFNAVSTDQIPNIETHNSFYTFSGAFGHHEVIVETPDDRQLWDLGTDHIKQILEVYRLRIIDLEKDDRIKYVQIFKNSGKDAGTSLVHSHSQIIAYNKVPLVVSDKVKAQKKYGQNAYLRIIESEKNSDRRSFENQTFVAFTPYASRFPFELLILPKRYVRSLSELHDNEMEDLAKILQSSLAKLKALNAPYNLALHYAPRGEELHLQLEIMPRLATWAGFEMNGDIINVMPPEDAAAFYRG